MYKILVISSCFLVSACTTDPIPEEEFEGPTSNFPLLGTVPDRPVLPEKETLIRQQNRLQTEHDEAEKKQDDLLKSLK